MIEIDHENCMQCSMCKDVCPAGALDMGWDRAATVDQDACIGCGACAEACPNSAITLT